MYAAAQFDKSEQKEAKFILPSGDIPLVTYSARREKGLRPPQASAIYSLNNTNRNRWALGGRAEKLDLGAVISIW